MFINNLYNLPAIMAGKIIKMSGKWLKIALFGRIIGIYMSDSSINRESYFIEYTFEFNNLMLT